MLYKYKQSKTWARNTVHAPAHSWIKLRMWKRVHMYNTFICLSQQFYAPVQHHTPSYWMRRNGAATLCERVGIGPFLCVYISTAVMFVLQDVRVTVQHSWYKSYRCTSKKCSISGRSKWFFSSPKHQDHLSSPPTGA